MNYGTVEYFRDILLNTFASLRERTIIQITESIIQAKGITSDMKVQYIENLIEAWNTLNPASQDIS